MMASNAAGRARAATALAAMALGLAVAACGEAPAGEAAGGGDATAALQLLVEARLDSLDAATGLYARHLPSGREVAVRADRVMNTLSVIKLAAMVRAFQQAEAGTLDLDARRRVGPADLRGGSGLLRTFQSGLEPTYRDLITQMIITSDNTATDLVVEAVGLDDINHMLDSLGYEATRFRMTTGEIFRALEERVASSAGAGMDAAEARFRFEGDSTVWLGASTPRETARLLTQIHAGELASPEHSEAMVAILRRQFYSSRLPRFIGREVQVAHKTGDWPPTGANDVGLVFYDGGPLVVAAYVNQNRSDFRTVEETLGRIAEDLIRNWTE